MQALPLPPVTRRGRPAVPLADAGAAGGPQECSVYVGKVGPDGAFRRLELL